MRPDFPCVPADRDAIGGYFGLEMPAVASPFDAGDAKAFQSARAAFLALLLAVRPSAVWMPWFICDSMLEPLSQAGVAVRRYALDDQFHPEAGLQLAAGECLLYVNYFGLCETVEAELRLRFRADRLIFDHAQALFAQRGPAMATLASPRKFIAAPDGGLLWTTRDVASPQTVDHGSVGRAAAMLQRAQHGAEAGYAAFQRAEASLSMQAPRAMSAVTRSMLAACDSQGNATARRHNFSQLHEALAPFNRLQLPALGRQVPLCYPLLPTRTLPREVLHRARVFVPTYWPELLEPQRAVPARERRWAATLLALPIDQRIDSATLQRHLLQPLLAYLATEETVDG
ncbi:MAG TPA: hypothetical protein VK570_18825 [Rubrivivax sp.]|nr:hypothetical protein [Rubrivivax sp.]